MTDVVTRVEVRKSATGYVVATLATSVAAVLGASIPVVIGVAVIAFSVTNFAVGRLLASRSSGRPEAAGQLRWGIALYVGAYIGIHLGREWFPWEGHVVESESLVGTFDITANAARTLIFAAGLGLVAWLVALLLPLQRYPAIARFESIGSGRANREIAPGEGVDLVLFGLAVASVVLPPMGAMNELTAPFGWPLVQIAAAFLLILPLVKKRSLVGALIAYRITFVAYAVLLVRLLIGTAPTLPFFDRSILGLAFAGVLAMCVLAHVRTAGLRDAKGPGGMRSGVVL